MNNQDLSFVDHIAVACSDLTQGVQYIEALLGVKSSIGGVHPGFGTKNHLIRLGSRCFLEIIGPDPANKGAKLPSLFLINKVKKPTLTRWIAASDNLSKIKERAENQNLDIGNIFPAQRKKPDGTAIEWKLSDPYKINFDGLVPFFIDWGTTNHPAEGLDQNCRLISLEAFHPSANELSKLFESLEIGIPVHHSSDAKLAATIECPNGLVQLS